MVLRTVGGPIVDSTERIQWKNELDEMVTGDMVSSRVENVCQGRNSKKKMRFFFEECWVDDKKCQEIISSVWKNKDQYGMVLGNIHMRISDGQLRPTVPNRSNYLHWIEDLLSSNIIPKTFKNGDNVRGFDIELEQIALTHLSAPLNN
ncbi:hypothetical protein Dsin_025915 [Dipteronia sinensis]|uniref:Uncharacterized protein n=1 Tax=Dipteronia sinensis TaxID=43782 RepID=A0AAD9ZX14_9ROSI|nr:hypothetical protein Dsin_025915 [Dipteronia sinensis]